MHDLLAMIVYSFVLPAIKIEENVLGLAFIEFELQPSFAQLELQCQ